MTGTREEEATIAVYVTAAGAMYPLSFATPIDFAPTVVGVIVNVPDGEPLVRDSVDGDAVTPAGNDGVAVSVEPTGSTTQLAGATVARRLSA
jgi:hypothetical protein